MKFETNKRWCYKTYQFKKECEIMKFETVIGLAVLAIMVIVGGLGNYFIDGLGV